MLQLFDDDDVYLDKFKKKQKDVKRTAYVKKNNHTIIPTEN
jgi:hypothetical protein